MDPYRTLLRRGRFKEDITDGVSSEMTGDGELDWDVVTLVGVGERGTMDGEDSIEDKLAPTAEGGAVGGARSVGVVYEF